MYSISVYNDQHLCAVHHRLVSACLTTGEIVEGLSLNGRLELRGRRTEGLDRVEDSVQRLRL